MLNGLYVSAAGMIGQIERQDVIANNLANTNTAGFKRSSVSFEAHLADSLSSHDRVSYVIPRPFVGQDGTQGEMVETANPSNLAIEGQGYFVLSTPLGEQLIRGGDFHLDSRGRLASGSDLVLGEKGPITITSPNWNVDAKGNVFVNGKKLDTLRIELPGGEPLALGDPRRGAVVQGRIEASNASAIREMTSMMTTIREYEASQKVIQALDQTLDKVINQMNRNA